MAVEDMTNKERYVAWAAEQDNLPIFLQPWWMEAVCIGKEWNVLLAENEQGEIMGVMPYLIRKRLGMRYIVMPQQTQIGGIWISGEYTEDQCVVAEVCRRMADQLGLLHLAYYYQQYAINSPIPALLANRGYTVSPRVTYRIEDCSDVEKIIAGYNRNKQRQLKKSAVFTLRQDNISPKEFFCFHQSVLATKGKVISYAEPFFLQLFDAIRQHHQGTILTLYDNQSSVQMLIAVALYVWDADAVHYLIAAQHPHYQHSGLMARLVTEGIRLAHQRHLAFDFEGSMIPGVAKHFAQFGAIPATYYSVERYFNPFFRFFTSAYQYLTHRKR